MTTEHLQPLSQPLASQLLVSIVAPCYNAEKYLEAALQSIFAQDYSNFEVIIVDDGSTDNSLAMLRALQDTYDFKLLTQQNQGVSATLNNGLKHARGVYVSTRIWTTSCFPIRSASGPGIWMNTRKWAA